MRTALTRRAWAPAATRASNYDVPSGGAILSSDAAGRFPNDSPSRLILMSTRADATPDVEQAEEPQPFVRRVFDGWRSIFLLILCVGGVGVSIYLTIVHFEPQLLVCTTTSFISCAPVLHSPQSVLFGVPVPFYGLFWFVSMFVLNLPSMWRTTKWWLPWTRVMWSAVGMCFIFDMIYDELFVIDKLCEWCTTVHVFTFAIFVTVVSGWNEASEFVISRRES